MQPRLRREGIYPIDGGRSKSFTQSLKLHRLGGLPLSVLKMDTSALKPSHRKGTRSLGSGLRAHKKTLDADARAKRRKYRKAESVQLSPNFGHRYPSRDNGTHHRKSSSHMPNLIRQLHRMKDDPLNANQSISDAHSSNKMIPARITDHDGKTDFRMAGHPTKSVELEQPHHLPAGVYGGRVFSHRGVFGALLYVETPGSAVSVLPVGGTILRAAETLHLNFESRQRDWYQNLQPKQLGALLTQDLTHFKRNAEALSAGGWHPSNRRSARNSRNMSGVIIHEQRAPGFTQALKVMKRGSQMLRVGGRRKILLQNFALTQDCTCIEGQVSQRSNQRKCRVPIVQISTIIAGPSKVFEDHQDLRYGNNKMPLSQFRDSTFTITWGPNNQTLDLVAPNPSESQLWIVGLQELVRRATSRRNRAGFGTNGSNGPAFNLTSLDADTEEFKLFKSTLHETILKLNNLQSKMQKLTREAITQVEIKPIASVVLEDVKVVKSLAEVWTKSIFNAHSVEVGDFHTGANSIIFPLKSPQGPETIKVLRSMLNQTMVDMISQMPKRYDTEARFTGVKDGIKTMGETANIDVKYSNSNKQRDCKTAEEIMKMLQELHKLKREVTADVGRTAGGLMEETHILCKAELRVAALGMYVQKRLNTLASR